MKFNFGRFNSIVVKEFIHVFRDPASLGVVLIMPFIYIMLFGFAITTDVNHIKLAVYDGDKTYESRELARKFVASDYFIISDELDNMNDIENLIDSSKVKAALIIPSGYSKKLKRGENPSSQLIIDGTDPTIARQALQSGVLVSNMYNISVIGEGNITLPEMRTRVWYNTNMESTKFIIPGLIGLIMQNITVMLTAFALVREKESGTIEQLLVSPLKPYELIYGKMVPYVLIGSIDFIVALFFGTWFFKVPIEGSLFLLLVLGFGFIITSLAIGILISTVSKNQLQAMQLSFVSILPTVLLSGFMFPIESMPYAIKLLSNVIPLTYFLNILRGIILKGIGLEFLWKDVLGVTAIGLFLLIMAVKRFHSKLD
ncbi:ABC transporter permease [Helicovermis profundi]|uniref:Transport permease protein n=1 Tax=Helicovermis profundi TaxID=3065157 RepID=A0AAU9ECY8_9FIRM|nr:ABC transporter permease [Clostridia bacterium S502]